MILSKPLKSNFTFNEHELQKFATEFFEKDVLQSTEEKVLFLIGELGCGKTFFTQSCLKKFNLQVTSPTFTILNTYSILFNNIEKKIFHIDLYRLEKINSLNELFDFDSFAKNDILFVEWPERLLQIEKKVDFLIYFDKDCQMNKRNLSIIKN